MMNLRIGNDAALVDASHHLRRRVFVEEQGVPEEEVFDGQDEGNVHIVLFQGDAPAATLRLTPGKAAWTVNLVAVDQPLRGQHLGETILRAAIDYAHDHGAPALCLTAQDHAVGFYRKFGFVPCGEPEKLESGFVLVPMRRDAP